jgi:prepilin-type N-terminal cleavage/methylation domain-containing protein
MQTRKPTRCDAAPAAFAPARAAAGFSLIELVIVVAIIGVIGAIAVPRLSGAAEDASIAAYKADLAILQDAVDRYYAEHAKYPAKAAFSAQLTRYTDAAGNVSHVKTSTHIYGPYLRKMPRIYAGAAFGIGSLDAGLLTAGTAPEEFTVTDPDNGIDTGLRFDARTGQVKLKDFSGMPKAVVESLIGEQKAMSPLTSWTSPFSGCL